MSRWFTSDLHFGHQNIIDFCERPFSSVDEMNWQLVARYNALVDPEDEVFFLGDICMGKTKDTLQFVELLHGTKYLIPGNHDKVWRGRSSWQKHLPAYTDAGFIVLGSQEHIEVNGTDVLLCHFPYFGDSHGEDRFTGNRPDDEGGWLICGHVHESWHQRGRMINVGVDQNDFEPFHEDYIIGCIEAGPVA